MTSYAGICVTRSCCSNISIKSLNKCDGWLKLTCLWWHEKGCGPVMVRLASHPASPCCGAEVAGRAEQAPSKELGLCEALTLLPADQLAEPPTSLTTPPLHVAHQTVPFLKQNWSRLPICLTLSLHSSCKWTVSSVGAHIFVERSATQDAIPQISFPPPPCKLCFTLVCNNKSTLLFLV